MRRRTSEIPASALAKAWVPTSWLPASCFSPLVTATYETPKDVRRKRTRSAMMSVFPASVRRVCRSRPMSCAMMFSPSVQPIRSALAPPGERVAIQGHRGVDGFGRIEDARRSAGLVVLDHRPLVDDGAQDAGHVGRATARDIHVAHADHDSP